MTDVQLKHDKSTAKPMKTQYVHQSKKILVLLGCTKYMRCSLLLQTIAVSVSLSATWLNLASLCKNGRMDQDLVWVE